MPMDIETLKSIIANTPDGMHNMINTATWLKLLEAWRMQAEKQVQEDKIYMRVV